MRWEPDRRLENIGKYPLKLIGAVGGWLALAAVIALVYNLVHVLLTWFG